MALALALTQLALLASLHRTLLPCYDIQAHALLRASVLGMGGTQNSVHCIYREKVPRYLFCDIIMVALWNRADHYIFDLRFLSFFRLISAAADWMCAILPHMVWP